IPYTTGSFQAGFQPTTALSTGSTIRTMQTLGYGSAELSLISDLRSLAAPVQNVKANPAQAQLPSETLTFNTAGMTQFKDLVKHTPQATLFGSAVLQPQLTKPATYTVADSAKGGKVEISNRLPMDIDIEFSGSPAQADQFVEQILQIGKETGNQLSVDPAQPYQILGVNRETGNPAHAFDIKVSGVNIDIPGQNNNPLAWGYEQSKPSTKIEGLPVQRLDEQINRLAFGSTLRFQPDRTMGPTSHRRAKDTLRTLHALETAYTTKGIDITVDPRFTRTMEYFGISRETYANTPKEVEYVLDDLTPTGRTSDTALDTLLGSETPKSDGRTTGGDSVSISRSSRQEYSGGGGGSVGSDRYSRSLLAAALGYPSTGSSRRRGSESASNGSHSSSSSGRSSGSGSASPVDILDLPSISLPSVIDDSSRSPVFGTPPPPSPYPSPSPSQSPYPYRSPSSYPSPYPSPYQIGTGLSLFSGNPGSMFDRRDHDTRKRGRKTKSGRQERRAPVAEIDQVLKRALKGLI
ncbi:MAG: hypothetical protein LBC12_01860, partial [Nitrososphaerota archaeon]|nr:hypothetical protein [Nitrososphaerota archaeon]